ncbi:MAG: DEAD/DEAH box helicase [Opitutaceae bacterium]|jgi:superfamily II DNA or RNA helicase|nr:DEAD/DEAH box helicase [Opitutaceae bacterium]
MPPRYRPTAVREVRTPEAIKALIERLSAFGERAQERGQEYLKGGAVASVWSEADHLVKAEVLGNASYDLTWFFTRGKWTFQCSCPDKKDCKHAYASGYAWITAVETGAPDGRRDPRTIPHRMESNFTQAVSSSDEHALEKELARWLRVLPSAEETAMDQTHPLFADLNGLRLRLDHGGNWLIEVRRKGQNPWRAPAQRWMNDLTKIRPADLEKLAPAEASLAAAIAAEARLLPTGLTAKRPVPAEAVAELLRTSAARPALAMPDGQPLTIEDDPLVPEATVSIETSDRLDLHMVTPDGRPAEDAVLVASRPEPLYLFEDQLWRGPPPSPAPQLPVAALSDARLLPRLRAVGLRLPDGIAAELKVVELKPRLKCWLTAGFDGEERELHAQLTAVSTHPPCEKQWTGDAVGWQWTKSGAPPPREVGKPALEFEFAQARAASESFTGFRLMWDGWADAWIRPVDDEFAESFLQWHAGLSPHIHTELSPEIASLLDEPLNAHVEVRLDPSADAEKDWFDLTVGLKIEDTNLSTEEIKLLLKARGKWVHLPQHGWRRVDAEAAVDEETTEALDRLGLGVADVLESGDPAKHRFHTLQLALEANRLAARDERMVERLKNRATKIASIKPPKLPSNLKANLRPYQTDGYHFLCHLSQQGFGGILADDMGLGKTVQALAWMLQLSTEKSKKAAKPKTENEPFRALVVCPKSVTHGWVTETARFTPDLTTTVFSAETGRLDTDRKHPDILVANYTQLRRHAERFRSVTWDVVVLDEGQFIKNPKSQVALAARALPARHRVVLTGTPIENRLTDLWSLFAFAQPGLLGDQVNFRRQYTDASHEGLQRLHRRVKHFLLRRTKAQAAPDLPKRSEDDVIIDLEGEQRELYDAELKRARAELLGVKTAKELGKVRFHVLASLLRLRQICCHPALIDPSHADIPSAKLDALLERVEELAEEGHQVLVFSQFVKMLNIIRDRLVEREIGHLILTGSTENRAELVDTFQKDPSKTVFLLSLKAAGFGLNLTAASYAILYDPWWNPAAEAQAIDRIHRIGQTKPVIAYRFITAGSVEEKIRALQHEKAALAASVVQEESLSKVMDLDSLRDILS